MANPFVHIELQTTDPEKAKRFYKNMFGWEYQELPQMKYTLFNMGQGTTGGIMQIPVPNSPSYWLTYVHVDEIKSATSKAKQLGASILHDVMEVGEYGWLSVIADPTGAAVGLWQPKTTK